ncbi:MAG: hypothetical protein A3J76_02055 [Candidatus Moranbacteria bacterium RBG_13_45_13]|nr:MAG: hypothetical protein A3J76_02055 [Candidatus Moranbacteria bacterium RBG_13_45_13]
MNKNSVLQQTIIEELGLNTLPQEKQDELMAKMAEVIVKRIYLETMESLNETDREELVKMLDAKAEPEQVENFLKGKIENYEEVVKKIIEGFKGEMKDASGKFDEKYGG